jgi:hypothetical protein
VIKSDIVAGCRKAIINNSQLTPKKEALAISMVEWIEPLIIFVLAN